MHKCNNALGGMVLLPDLRASQKLGGWGRAGSSQRAPSAPALELGASPYGHRQPSALK